MCFQSCGITSSTSCNSAGTVASLHTPCIYAVGINPLYVSQNWKMISHGCHSVSAAAVLVFHFRCVLFSLSALKCFLLVAVRESYLYTNNMKKMQKWLHISTNQESHNCLQSNTWVLYIIIPACAEAYLTKILRTAGSSTYSSGVSPFCMHTENETQKRWITYVPV